MLPINLLQKELSKPPIFISAAASVQHPHFHFRLPLFFFAPETNHILNSVAHHAFFLLTPLNHLPARPHSLCTFPYTPQTTNNPSETPLTGHHCSRHDPTFFSTLQVALITTSSCHISSISTRRLFFCYCSSLHSQLRSVRQPTLDSYAPQLPSEPFKQYQKTIQLCSDRIRSH